jgi:hypothetical protein
LTKNSAPAESLMAELPSHPDDAAAIFLDEIKERSTWPKR